MMAKWVAFAGSQGMEMFFEINRTHYPGISPLPSWKSGGYNADYTNPVTNPGYFSDAKILTYSLEGTTSGLFPKSLVYPQDEVTLNDNFPGQRLVTDKVWWDVKP
jgi:hypothetical protein